MSEIGGNFTFVNFKHILCHCFNFVFTKKSFFLIVASKYFQTLTCFILITCVYDMNLGSWAWSPLLYEKNLAPSMLFLFVNITSLYFWIPITYVMNRLQLSPYQAIRQLFCMIRVLFEDLWLLCYSSAFFFLYGRYKLR